MDKLDSLPDRFKVCDDKWWNGVVFSSQEEGRDSTIVTSCSKGSDLVCQAAFRIGTLLHLGNRYGHMDIDIDID